MERKSVALLAVLAVVLALSVASLSAAPTGEAARPAPAGVNATGFPIVKDKITLKGFGRLDPQHQPWGTMTLWKEYEAMTNIAIQWETPGMDNVAERKNLVLASGDLPDFFIKNVLTTDDLVKYGADGALIALEGLIPQWAPNLAKLLAENPGWRQSITAPNGHVYGLPRISVVLSDIVYRYPLVNTAWLKRLNLKAPEDHQQFLAVMRAFRDQDANGNGDPGDELPYSAHDPQLAMHWILGMFGVTSELVYDGDYPIRLRDGQVHIQIADPEYKEALQYMARMYAEKLLDREVLTHTNKDYFGKLAAGRIGFTPLYQPRNAGKYAKEYDAMVPPKGPRGDNLWIYFQPPVTNVEAFAITRRNAHPEATMRWIDYFYSVEGSTHMRMVGKDFYDEMPDGTLQYKKSVLEAPEGMTRLLGKHTIWGGGSAPGYFVDKNVVPSFAGTPMPFYVDKVKACLPRVTERAPLLDVDAAQRIREIRADLDTYVAEMRAKFIAGQASFDQWDSHVATLEKMGLRELEQILTKAMSAGK